MSSQRIRAGCEAALVAHRGGQLPGLLMGCILAGASASTAQPYVLVEDGVARCAIILPADSTAPMEYGARDLSRHLQLMSGAEVPVHRLEAGAAMPGDYDGLIVLTSTPEAGEPTIGAEELRITAQPGTPWVIRIYGDQRRGAMYGCYALLQDVLGCRWFTSTISKVPQQKTIAVGALRIHQKPSFEYREPFYWEALVHPEWIVRNRVNSANGHVDDSMGGKVRYGSFVHTLFTLVPPDRHFNAHPEYFALVRGQRVRHTQLCLTNPDVVDLAITGVRQWIKDHPEAGIFSVSQMDNEGGACQCENCARVTEEEGSESGPILRFVNAVALEIGKEYPGILLDTLAYNYSQKPPRLVRPLPNVRVRLCIPWTCKAQRLDSVGSQDTYQDLHAWGQITQQLYVWDYNTEFNDYMLLHPSLNYTKTVFGILRKTGVVGVFMQGSYQSPGGALAEMKAYLCARLMWDHTQNGDEILREYLTGVYGSAAPIVAEWLALIHSPFERDTGVKMLGIYDRPEAAYLRPNILERSDELLDRAGAAVAREPAALEEIGKIRLWVDYTHVARIRLAGQVAEGRYSYGVSEADLDRIDRFLASVRHYQVTHFAEAVPSKAADMLTRATAQVACLTLENDHLRLDVLPTLGGKIARLLDKKRAADLMLPPKSVFHRSDGGYESYLVEAERGDEFWGIRYDARREGNTLLLTGRSPAGREVTRGFTLEGPTLRLRTTVRNAASQPLPVRLWDRPLFPLRTFADVSIAFATVGGGQVRLEAKDFSINWSELSKQYQDGDLPAGLVTVRLRDTTLTLRFEQAETELLRIWNNGGVTEMISPQLHGKAVILQAGETTSFERSWTVE
jgi:hypothetical protein